jgi:hypothetical protein
MLRRSAAAAAILALAGCSSGDYEAKSIAKGFKSDVDWVRDAFGQPVARISKDDAAGPYPDAPADKRPLPRSLKQQTEMIGALKADHDNAAKIETALAQSEPSKFLFLNGAKPTGQPVAVTFETVDLPDGIRDIDSYDPSQAGNRFQLGSVDFKEGESEFGDEEDEGLRRAAQLVKKQGTLRVMGYAVAEHLTMEGKGPHEAGRWLANLRARKVAAKLTALGAPPRQLLVGPAPEATRASGDKVEIIIDY